MSQLFPFFHFPLTNLDHRPKMPYSLVFQCLDLDISQSITVQLLKRELNCCSNLAQSALQGSIMFGEQHNNRTQDLLFFFFFFFFFLFLFF